MGEPERLTTATRPTTREVAVDLIQESVAAMLMEANYRIPPDILEALRESAVREESALGRQILEQLIRNYEIAAAERLPVCQDSGVTVVMIELGQDVHLVGGNLKEAISEGVRAGTRDGFLRWSVAPDPIARATAGDRAAAVIHLELVPGDQIGLTVVSKGFGAENMSALQMLTPADGLAGVKRFVVATVERAGANACPPIIVGVGVGGTFEQSALLAKKAVIRPVDRRNPAAHLAKLEQELLQDVNALGIGPQGLGGLVTALAVNVETAPTHIAGLPVAVNLGCHSTRRVSTVL